MKKLLLVSLLFLSGTVHAGGPWNRLFQDIKIPSQKVLDHDGYATPIASSNSILLINQTLSNLSINTFTSFSAQPDYPRNILIVPQGKATNIAAGTATVFGYNALGSAIQEQFTIGGTQSVATVGNLAFKSVTSVQFPQATGAALGNLSVGVGSKLGIKRCMDQNGDYVFSEVGGVYDVTRGTAASNPTAVESNTITPNGSMDGTKRVDVFYIQNYRCY